MKTHQKSYADYIRESTDFSEVEKNAILSQNRFFKSQTQSWMPQGKIDRSF